MDLTRFSLLLLVFFFLVCFSLKIFQEIDRAKRRHGKLNTIVMNAVVEACVHCRDVDSALRIFQEMSESDGCGVDSITFATLLKVVLLISSVNVKRDYSEFISSHRISLNLGKGLGEAQRIDEAFQMLESMEQGTAAGNPKLSPSIIHGLLNALLEAG